MVFDVLFENPHIIQDALRGTGHGLGFGLIFDRIFHVLPAPLLSFYIYARWADFERIYVSFYLDVDTDKEQPTTGLPVDQISSQPSMNFFQRKKIILAVFFFEKKTGQAYYCMRYLCGANSFLVYSVCATLSPLVLLILYVSLFNIERMYGIHNLPMIATIAIALLVLLVFNVVIFTVLFYDAYTKHIQDRRSKVV